MEKYWPTGSLLVISLSISSLLHHCVTWTLATVSIQFPLIIVVRISSAWIDQRNALLRHKSRKHYDKFGKRPPMECSTWSYVFFYNVQVVK